MKRRTLKLTGITMISAIFICGCMADMRTALIRKEGISELNQSKGKEILNRAWKKQGFDKLKDKKVYSFNAHDIWKGVVGKIGKPWPEANSTLAFKYEVGSFDGQVTFLDGRRKGTTAGLQSWNYYEIDSLGLPSKKKIDKRVRFGLSAYQYFFEMLDRLKRASIITYAGTTEFNGYKYDIVFVTWKRVEPHKQHDQYKLYINKSTGLLDYSIFTLRENYLKFPGSAAFYGSIIFDDYRAVDGVMIPYTQTIFFNKPKKKLKKHLHQLKVYEFSFDLFDGKLLKPFSDIKSTGDSKVKG